MYVLAGCTPEGADQLRGRLEELGESVAIAAAPDAGYSVHVHTDDAGAAIEAALEIAAPSRIQISSLQAGPSGAAPASWSRDRAVLAVVDGDGAAELFGAEGASVLRPEPPVAVSAQQLVRAIVDTGAASVMVLPNGYVAAEELVAGCTAAIGCRCPPARWSRGWPRWPCTIWAARPSTTATPWRPPPARRGSDPCGRPPRTR
jgi:dihydroxyacetone kinase-like predicted kinase